MKNLFLLIVVAILLAQVSFSQKKDSTKKSTFFVGKWQIDSTRINNYFDFVTSTKQGFEAMFRKQVSEDKSGLAKKQLDKVLKETNKDLSSYVDSLVFDMFGTDFMNQIENGIYKDAIFEIGKDGTYKFTTSEVEAGKWELLEKNQILFKSGKSGVVFKYEMDGENSIVFTMVNGIDEFIDKNDYQSLDEKYQQNLLIVHFFGKRINY
jgi:hypothetical protein